MSQLTLDEQHEGRNAVLCLKDFTKQLRKSNRISDQECTLSLVWIERIGKIFDGCKHGKDT